MATGCPDGNLLFYQRPHPLHEKRGQANCVSYGPFRRQLAVQRAADDADLIAVAATILVPLGPKRVNIESTSLPA
jgi:hypothetical protein